MKLSKSLGNAISPYPLIERYSADSLRYYIVREIEFGTDGNFTPTQFIDRLNSDLANSYGNLVNRTLSMLNKYFQGVVPEFKDPMNDFTKKLYEEIEVKLTQYNALMEDFKITEGASKAIELVNLGNKYFDDVAPWTQAKNGNIDLLKECLYAACEIIRIGSIILSPIMPNKTKDALDQENVPEELRTLASTHEIGKLSNIHINELHALFPRLKKEEEVAYLTELIDGPSK